MVWVGGLIVILAFAAIIKRYETRLVLLVAGFLMAVIGGNMDGAMQAFVKAMTNAGLVPVICTVMGFSFVMKVTECDKHLVRSLSSVMNKGQAILIPLAFAITWVIGLALPSAAGCSAAVGAILIPTLIGAGVHPAMAASTILMGTMGSSISPGNSHNAFVADLAGTDMITVIMAITPTAIVAAAVAIVILTAIAMLQKEGVTEERRLNVAKNFADDGFKVSAIKAFVPLLPLILLVLGSKQVGVLPPVSVPMAMLVGAVIGFVVTFQNPQDLCKNFFDGMGSAYGGVIGIIIAAAVFTQGMQLVGLTDALIETMKTSESIAKVAAAVGPFTIALLCGSGDAAALAFNGAITPHAADFGMQIMDLGSLAQMTGALGRAASPVSGAAIICAQLAGVNTMELTKRNVLPMFGAAITMMLLLVF